MTVRYNRNHLRNRIGMQLPYNVSEHGCNSYMKGGKSHIRNNLKNII